MARQKYKTPDTWIMAHTVCGTPLRLVKVVWTNRISTFWECPIHGECPSDEREFMEVEQATTQ